MEFNYKELVEDGAKIINPLEYYAVRPKACGYMWEGRATLAYKEYQLHMVLWWHGPEPEDMSMEKAEVRTYPRGIKDLITGKYYDCSWHVVTKGGKMWLHEKGWFGFDPESREMAEWLLKNRTWQGWKDTVTDQDLIDRGFRVIF